MRKILWSWSTKNPLVALPMMLGLVWGFLNIAHIAVLATSDRTADLNRVIGKRIELDFQDGDRQQGMLVGSGMCFRGAIMRWRIRIEEDADGAGQIHEHVCFEWQLPRARVLGNP